MVHLEKDADIGATEGNDQILYSDSPVGQTELPGFGYVCSARTLALLVMLGVACSEKKPPEKTVARPPDAAVAVAPKPIAPEVKPAAPRKSPMEIAADHVLKHPIASLDDVPGLLELTHHEGRFSPEELRKKTKTLAPGVTVIVDNGLAYYVPVKDDNLDLIVAKLSAIPDYAYLKDMSHQKIQFFNVVDIRAGRPTPIPGPEKDRQISPQAFAAYMFLAFQKELDHPEYGPKLRRVMEETGMTAEDFVQLAVAVARQESGGLPLGIFQLFRQEPRKVTDAWVREACFSYSHFHILMDQYRFSSDGHLEEGPGLRARRKLKMTEGQTVHPLNEGMLFLSYLMEKVTKYDLDGKEVRNSFNPKKLRSVLPVNKHWREFAVFYNGGGIHTDNYVALIKSYYLKAAETMQFFTGKVADRITEADLSHKMCTQLGCKLKGLISDSNMINSPMIGKQSILRLDENIDALAGMIEKYLADKHKGDSRLYPGDKVLVFEDRVKGPFVKFSEGNGVTDHAGKGRKAGPRIVRQDKTPGVSETFYLKDSAEHELTEILPGGQPKVTKTTRKISPPHAPHHGKQHHKGKHHHSKRRHR